MAPRAAARGGRRVGRPGLLAAAGRCILRTAAISCPNNAAARAPATCYHVCRLPSATFYLPCARAACSCSSFARARRISPAAYLPLHIERCLISFFSFFLLLRAFLYR